MVSINFVGDVAFFKHYEVLNLDPLDQVKLPKCDLNIANFEFPIPNDDWKKKFYDVDDNYRISHKFSTHLKLNTFDFYSLANNHIQDYGSNGIIQTIQKIKKQGSYTFGVGKDFFNTASREINGIKLLFIGCVKKGRWDRQHGMIGPDTYNIEDLLLFVKNNKKNYNHIIIYPHWGTELVDAPYHEDIINAHKLIDAGASCVIGHHPHVIQGIEYYNSGLIAYSLGSFIYLPDFEKGNSDKSITRDISICLNVVLDEKKVINFTPYKYVLNKHTHLPENHGDFSTDSDFKRLCTVIGNQSYYAHMVRKVLLWREIASFKERFLENPFSTIFFYLKYLKLSHIKKIFG